MSQSWLRMHNPAITHRQRFEVASSSVCPEEQVEEEAAVPGLQFALARVSEIPRRFTLENRRLPLAL